MDGRISVTSRIIYCTRYSRLFEVYHEKQETVTDNPPIKIHVNQIKNKIAFRIKTRYDLKL